VSGVRRWRWLAALAAVAVVVAGVVVLRTGDVADAPSRPKVEIREGGTVRATALLEPSGFNPNTSKDEGVALQAVAVTMYPSVFRVHPDFSIRLDPTFMVAAELTSHDPQTITYRIRPDARWSDGTPITAADFHYLWRNRNGTNPRTDTVTTVGYDRIKQVTGSADGKPVTVVFDQRFADWQTPVRQPAPRPLCGPAARRLEPRPRQAPRGHPFRGTVQDRRVPPG
jgi:ABC-type transport system substrate-binding protein